MSDFLTKFLRLLVVCWFALGVGLTTADAQRKKKKEPELPPAPPPVVARTIIAQQGETVNIPLTIHGSRNEQLQFILRSKPKLGKISKVTSTGLNSASVTYSAPNEGTEDRFTYAVRSKEGVSAAGLVVINLNARPMVPPRLIVPESLEFPPVILGQRSTVTFDVSNQGGGLVNGSVTVEEPWRIEEHATYRLGPGAKTSFKLIFEPKKTGDFSVRAELGPEPRRVITLVGSAQAPLAVTPDRLWIEATGGGQTRMGKMQIENRSEQVQSVTLTAGNRLLIDKTVEVPARGKLEVPVFAEPTVAGAFEEKLRLSTGDWNIEVPVQVAALGPMLKWMTPTEPPPPGVADAPSEWILHLENQGGRSAVVNLSVNAPFELLDAKLEIAPAAKQPVRVIGDGLIAGNHVASITAETEGKTERTTLNVEVKEAAPRPTPPAVAPIQQVEKAPLNKTSAPDAMNWIRPPGREEHPNAMGDFVAKVETERAVLQWPANLGPSTNLSIEERRLSQASDGKLNIKWLPLPGVSFQVDNDPCRAELPRLKPGQLYTVRVRSGEDTLFTAQFTTRPEPPWLPFGWRGIVVSLLVLVLVGIGWYKWKHRTRSTW